MASDSQVYYDKRIRQRRNSDGVRMERLRKLKTSLLGYRGAISRAKSRLEALLQEDPIDRVAVKFERDSLDQTFIRYMNCCDEYKENLNSEDELEINRVDSEGEAMYKMKLDLERGVNELLVNVQVENTARLASQDQQEPVQDKLPSYRSKEHERSTIPEYSNKGYGDLNLKENVRVTSRASNGSEHQHLSKSDKWSGVKTSRASDMSTSQRTAGSAGLRKLKARLYKTQCLERQEIERHQRAIDQQMELIEIKQEMQNRQAELRNKRELLQLEGDIEQANLEEDAEHSSVNFERSRSASYYTDIEREDDGISRVQDWIITTSNENDSRFPFSKTNRINDRAPYYDQLNLTSQNQDGIPITRNEFRGQTGRRQVPPCSVTREKATVGSVPKNYGPERWQDSADSLRLIAETLGTTIRKGFDMPKRNSLTFDGNPMNYPKFIENFKITIEDREPNERDRLQYLIQFCTGVVKESISNCVMLPEQEGYKKAREILQNLYGQNHVITCAYINKVTKGGAIREGETEKLLELARDMENCQINLTQLGCESEINAQSNLERIVSRLPRYLQAEWAKEAFKTLERNKVPTFKDLNDFIMVKAKLASSAFGRLVGSKPQEDKLKSTVRTNWKQKTTSFAVQSNSSAPRCYHCEKVGHLLEKCYTFQKLSFEARRQVVWKQKLCNLCLCKGHFAKQCKRKSQCLVADCGKRHHSLLHPVKSSDTVVEPKSKDESNVQINMSDDKGDQDEVEPKYSGAQVGRAGVRLRVIPVKVRGMDGAIELETYALLDEGSDVSLCHGDLVKRLGIIGTPTTFSLTTVNSDTKECRGEEVRLFVSDLGGSEEEIDITRAWTVNGLPISKKSIPTSSDVARWSHLDGLEFPELENKSVTIIIGSDVPEAHWVLDQRRGKPKEPYAVKTPLGWTLIGPAGCEPQREFHVNFIHSQDDLLHEKVDRMTRIDFSENDSYLE